MTLQDNDLLEKKLGYVILFSCLLDLFYWRWSEFLKWYLCMLIAFNVHFVVISTLSFNFDFSNHVFTH